ncbi:unnamed protein product [Linum tenue]|uniref:Protein DETOXIFICATION n=1 Tax=Linum tenue TaxID=586396 RepID=A0AAV0KR19_9ROSI|nr:unnamed protein product [Linum tenue]
MAAAVSAGISHELLLGVCSSTPKSRTLFRNNNSNCFILRSRTVPRSLSQRGNSEASSNAPEVSPIPVSNAQLENDDLPVPLLRRVRNAIKLDELGLEILSIAFPAALALAADPIISLVDTAFVGHIGAVELAAVGVSVSIFNLVSKLFNVPLLNITTSFVAEEQALLGERASTGSVESGDGSGIRSEELPSVSTSLVLASIFGVAEAVALYIGSGFLMNIMGIPVGSPMRAPAEQFLTLRAIGAPPIVIALAAQGAFRGYLIAIILLWKLNDKVKLVSPEMDGRRLIRYLNSGGLLIGRTVAVLLTMTLSTSLAAREGPIFMAGHQICMQVWLAVSLLNDALAIAGQALLAGGYSKGQYEEARQVTYKVLQIGLGTGMALGATLLLGFGSFASLFTTDAEVLKIASSGIWFVAGSQPVNAVAFVLDGLYYGVSDFGYAAYSMVVVGLISSLFLLWAAPLYGLPGVWAGLFLFMILRVLAGIWRLGDKNGPWKVVWAETNQEKE